MTVDTYEIIDGLASLWLFLIGIAWIFTINDPAYYATLMLCEWITHMGEPLV